jgi:NADH-quinone oxidoreductase subunit N
MLHFPSMIGFPEIWVFSFACLALLGDLFFSDRYEHIAYTIVQLGLIGAFILVWQRMYFPTAIGFNGFYIDDVLARILKLFIMLTAYGAFLYGWAYVEDRGIARGEYYILGLFSTLGMMVLVSANSFITVYLGLELLSLPLYAMVALERENAKATEAALKYFVMGAIASGMLLYGLSMTYGATGHLMLGAVSKAIANTPADKIVMLAFGLVFVTVGIGFKLAAAPFHMWAPDVYTGAPSSTTLFLSSVPKLAAFGMAVRLFIGGFASLHVDWQQMLMVLAILSMGVGNFLAIAQTNFKRMLAYSAIAHIGYMLLGLVAGNAAGYSAALFYILIYSLMSLAAFGFIVLLSRKGFEAENIEDLQGLNSRHPWLAFLLMVVMFSMAGIPPTAGFLAKLFVITALVNAHLVWLAVLAMFFALVGAYYYLRIVKVIYFEQPAKPMDIVIAKDAQWVLSINGLLLLVFGLFPGALLHICKLAF